MDNTDRQELLEMWLALNQFQNGLKERLELELQSNYNLSLNEFLVLYYLSRTEEKKLRLQQLQELVGLSQSAMSRLVLRMEAKNCGALQRNICEDDRRGVYTSMTAYGETKLQKALNTVNEVMQSALSKDQLQMVLELLTKRSGESND